jgi:hypothetical protein
MFGATGRLRASAQREPGPRSDYSAADVADSNLSAAGVDGRLRRERTPRRERTYAGSILGEISLRMRY